MAPFKFIFTLACLLFGAYLVYAVWQSGDVPKTIRIDSSANFKNIPATRCVLSNSSGRVTGTLRVFQDAARLDITSQNPGGAVVVHLLVNREDVAYYWQEGRQEGARGDYGHVHSAVGLQAITRITCRPWLFPYGGYFIVPQGISFSKSI